MGQKGRTCHRWYERGARIGTSVPSSFSTASTNACSCIIGAT
jgi:hypothetical protein